MTLKLLGSFAVRWFKALPSSIDDATRQSNAFRRRRKLTGSGLQSRRPAVGRALVSTFRRSLVFPGPPAKNDTTPYQLSQRSKERLEYRHLRQNSANHGIVARYGGELKHSFQAAIRWSVLTPADDCSLSVKQITPCVINSKLSEKVDHARTPISSFPSTVPLPIKTVYVCQKDNEIAAEEWTFVRISQ
jgi:hypothetical protein